MNRDTRMEKMRGAGVLMPIASLPSAYGIGDFGKEAYEFADYLKKMGISVWQILPLNPLGYGNSPYQPYSSFAGDELYISLDQLYEEHLLSKRPKPFQKEKEIIDYAGVRAYKEPFLHEAYTAFMPEEDSDYQTFIQQEWVFLYAVFMAFKKDNALCCWLEWKEEQKNWIKTKQKDDGFLYPYQYEIEYQMFLQYQFYKQWVRLKEYVNSLGIQIMGDIPFYVGIDSLDVWENQEGFLLDGEGYPTVVAGVPPDYFSATGQRWGNPIYNWEQMKKTGFIFWLERLKYNQKMYDIIRIDHFRAFDTYWEIPSSSPTAVKGNWLEAPGYEFFDLVFQQLKGIQIVVEDLGDLRPEVGKLRDFYQFPGMKVLQFSVDPEEKNNDFPDRENMILYTGTHDNQTIRGWYESQPEKVQNSVDALLKSKGCWNDYIAHSFISYAMSSVAKLTVISVQDILNLGDECRINMPGTLGTPNWEWRLNDLSRLDEGWQFVKDEIEKSKRINGVRRS